MTADTSEQHTDLRFRSLVFAISSIVWTTDSKGQVAEPSDSWTQFTGQSFEEFRGAGWLDAVHPEDREHARSVWAGAVAEIRMYEVEYRLRHRSGDWRHVLARGAPVLDDAGQIREWIGNCVDISDRVNIEEALREEVRITDILHNMGLALAAELDLQKVVGRIVDAATAVIRAKYGAFLFNIADARGAHRLFHCVSGLAPDAFADFSGTRASLIFTPAFVAEGAVRLADVTHDPRYGRTHAFASLPAGIAPVRSYLAIPVVSRTSELIGGLFFGHDVPGRFAPRDERIVRGIAAQSTIAVDNARLVQDLRDAKQHLGQQLEFTRNITESVGEGLYAVDDRGRATFVNPAAEAMLGWASQDLLGKDMHELIHYQHADGSDFPKETCPLMSVLATGFTVRRDDDTFIRHDGSHFPVAYTSSPTTEGDKIIGAVVAFHDITQIKWAEQTLRQSKEQLEQLVSERTSALELANAQLSTSNRELQDFASVASHDLQEPLRKIQAFGDRLDAKSGETLGPEGKDYLNRMRNAAGRMQTLISDLLQFSRITTQAQPFTPVDLSRIISEVLIDLETAIERTGGRVEFGPLPTIDADPTQMRQLVQNLLGNALKFHRTHVPPLVKVDACIDESANLCHLSFRDNGIGFEEKYLDRIFNVFQRLHSRGIYEGTGIGLAVCRKIAERHGGSITAQSMPDLGSTFVVTLPIRHPNTEENNG